MQIVSIAHLCASDHVAAMSIAEAVQLFSFPGPHRRVRPGLVAPSSVWRRKRVALVGFATAKGAPRLLGRKGRDELCSLDSDTPGSIERGDILCSFDIIRPSTQFGVHSTQNGIDMTKELSLASALFSNVQQRVLGLIFGNPERSFYTSEILRSVHSGRVILAT
ncbi:hypothetical protein ACVINW_003968 [Bradyrhizobium sp. USDA 4461]